MTAVTAPNPSDLTRPATRRSYSTAWWGMAVVKAWTGRYDHGRHASAEVFFLYWHFVDVVWLLVFPIVFVSPHIR